MAKKSGVNKSQHIRDYFKQHPNAMPKEVVEALGARGIDVTTGLVSGIKYASGSKKGKKKRSTKKSAKRRTGATKKTRSRTTSAGNLTAKDLMDVKKLVDQFGTIQEARRALDFLEQLKD